MTNNLPFPEHISDISSYSMSISTESGHYPDFISVSLECSKEEYGQNIPNNLSAPSSCSNQSEIVCSNSNTSDRFNISENSDLSELKPIYVILLIIGLLLYPSITWIVFTFLDKLIATMILIMSYFIITIFNIIIVGLA